MSIEQNLSSIAKSLEIIAAVLSAGKQAAPVATPAPVVTAPVVAASAPVATPAPAPVVAAPTMFATPAPAPTVVPPSSVPFADHAEMLSWIMSKYKVMGPIKGAKIQNALESLGVKNVNDVKPEMYAALVEGVNRIE